MGFDYRKSMLQGGKYVLLGAEFELKKSNKEEILKCVEELGFIGAGTLLILYAFLLYRGLHAAMMSKDLYGTLVAAGIVSMYLFHILENVGMTMGLMPVTGIPLPFVSYGGSSTLTNLLGIAILQNIYIHRERLMF